MNKDALDAGSGGDMTRFWVFQYSRLSERCLKQALQAATQPRHVAQCTIPEQSHLVWLYAGFQSHAHLQAGVASLAGTPDAVVSFLDQAHVASRDRVSSLAPSRTSALLHTPHQLSFACKMWCS